MKSLKLILTVLLIESSMFFNTLKAQQMATSNSQLSSKDRNIITISSFTAQGKLAELKDALNSGLDAGLTMNEIKEMLVHSYAYCGFPRSIRGLQTFLEVVEERKKRGVKNNEGAEVSPIVNKKSKYERGKDILGKLSGTPPIR